MSEFDTQLASIDERLTKFDDLKEQFKDDALVLARVDALKTQLQSEKTALQTAKTKAERFAACAVKRQELTDWFEAEDAKRFLERLPICCEEEPCGGSCLYCDIMKLKNKDMKAEDIRLLIGF